MINLCPAMSGLTYEGFSLADTLRKLEEVGAAVVGLNCSYGPSTIVDGVKEVRAVCKVRNGLGAVVSRSVSYHSVQYPRIQLCWLAETWA